MAIDTSVVIGVALRVKGDGNEAAGHPMNTTDPSAGTGAVKRWDGSQLVQASSIKRWDGTQFVEATSVKRWDGTTWVEAT